MRPLQEIGSATPARRLPKAARMSRMLMAALLIAAGASLALRLHAQEAASPDSGDAVARFEQKLEQLRLANAVPGMSAALLRDQKLVWHYGWFPPTVSALYLKVPERNLSFILLGSSDRLSARYRWSALGVRASPYAKLFLEHFVFGSAR